jgi:hypothetical protein
MENAKRSREENRIRYPPSSWIPVPAEFFRQVLPALEETRAAGLLLTMHVMVRSSRERRLRANLTDLSAQMHCDSRIVRRCLDELGDKSLVVRVHRGTKRSRSDKPRWRVPLSEFALSAGGWVPVPRFLITHYLPVFPGSLLLIILLFYEHHGWRNDCWPGVGHLAELTGWKSRTVYRALNLMGHRHRWERLGTGLPWPLEVTWRPSKKGGEIRHFRVRAVHYHSRPGYRHPVVSLTREFGEYFGLLKKPASPATEAGDDAA